MSQEVTNSNDWRARLLREKLNIHPESYGDNYVYALTVRQLLTKEYADDFQALSDTIARVSNDFQKYVLKAAEIVEAIEKAFDLPQANLMIAIIEKRYR